jgi:hypothetical protein
MNSSIEIKTEFFPMAWFLHFVSPVIEINGQVHPSKWGVRTFDLPPGDYMIKIYFPYMFQKQCGANEIKVSLAEGQQRKVNYNMPPWMFSKGVIKEA